MHSNIRSIDVLSGDTLKLTSAQFQKLLDAESAAGELFSGKIKLDTTLSGTYLEVYAQITDYRIALEEGFAASEYSAVVSDEITVAKANNLLSAGLVMSNVTYTIKDTLALVKTQADSDTGSVLAQAADVQFINSEGAAVVIDDDTATNHSDLNTIAGVATGTITATVQGTGANLADGTLSNLANTDQVTFRIQTSATPANVTTLSGLTKDSYLIDFSTNSAVVSGAYTDFINKGAATVKADYTNVLDHTASAPITLSGITVNAGDVDATPAKIAADLKKLTDEAEGPVTVTITNGSADILSATVDFTSDDAFSFDIGTVTASDSIITAINALVDQNSANGLTSITGTINDLTSTQAGNLSTNLTSTNSTLDFYMKNDSTGTLSVSAADGLLDHTASSATVDFAGGIEDTLSAFASTTATTDELRAIYSEDNTIAITVDNSGTALSSANDVLALNQIASLFQNSGTGTISATITAVKSVLLSGNSAQLGTDGSDTITITSSEVLTPDQWAALKTKTGGTVTASAGFSAALSQYADENGLKTNWDNAVQANQNSAVTITDEKLTSANEIAALNHIASDAHHTGAAAVITATVEANLATLDVGNLDTTNSDIVAFTVTDTDLTNAHIAGGTGINALKGKTGGVVTVGGVSATAAQLGSLTTSTTDAVSMTATGTGASASNIANSLVLATKTNSLSKISIEGIRDTQDNIAGSIASDTTGLAELKTLSSTSSTTDAIDALYGRVTGTVSISGGNITVDNAINISSFTVGSGSGTPITYSITDGAGNDSGTTGVATSSAAVNRAIANATAVVASEALTVEQAKEMLEDASGNPLTGTPTKFTFAISDTYTSVTNASSSVDSLNNSDDHAKLAHTLASNSNGVTLTPASVQDLIPHYSALSTGSHTYTVKDTIENLSASTANLDTLLSKASSIQIVDAPGTGTAVVLDGNNSDVRDQIRTIVSRAVDGLNAVPITASLKGNHLNMLGASAVVTGTATPNPITFTGAGGRADDITLTVDTSNHSISDLIALKALTNQSTFSFDGNLGIGDTIDNLTKTDGSDVKDDVETIIAATSSPKVALTAFTIDSDNDIKQLNALAAEPGIGAITGTVTDTSGTFILDRFGTLIGMTDDDVITLDLTNTGFTFTDHQVTRFSSVVNATGISSITGSATISSTRAGLIGAINDSSNKIGVNFTLSEQSNIANASALVGNTSGTVTFHNDGISNALSGFVDSSASSGLSSGWTAISNEDGTVNITVTGFTDPVEATEITQFNTAAAETTGTITASITGIGTRLASLSTSAFGGADPLTLTITDNVSVSNFNTIDGRTNQDVTLNTGIEDTFSALHDGTNPVAGVQNAVADDNDIMIKVSNKVTDNFSRINDLEAITNFTGKITATLEGSASELAHATNLNNLSDATGGGHTADDITFNVIGDASLTDLVTIAGRTSRTDITVSGNVTGTVENFITALAADEANFTTLKGHTDGEPISLSSAFTVDGTAAIDRVNALLSGAEGTVTGTINDSGGAILAGTDGKRILTDSDDSITVNVGNINPTGANLTQLANLANQSGITSITGTLTISSQDIDTLITGDTYANLTTSNNNITWVLDNKVTAAQAAGLVNKSSGSITWHSIEDGISGLIKVDGSAVHDDLSAALGKDNTVSVNITGGALTDSAHVLGVNQIVAGIHSANTVTASFDINKSKAAQFSGVSLQPLTITVSDAMEVGEFNTLNGVTNQDITLTSGISDSITNLVPTGLASALQAAINQDAGATLNVTVTPAVTSNHAKVSTLAAAVPGSITAAISGTASELTGITGLSDTNDAIDFTITTDATVEQINAIAGDTNKTNIAFSTNKGIADTLAKLIAANNTSKTDHFNNSLNHLAVAPTIDLTDVTLSSNDNIVAFNSLTGLGNDIGAVTGTLIDNNGQYLLATTGEGVTAPSTTSDDVITFNYGTGDIDATDAKITKLIANAQLSGTTIFEGSMTGIDANQAATIGSNTHINDQATGSHNTSTMTFTTDAAISPLVAKNLAGKGTAVYGAGLTGALSDYDDGTALHTNFSTAATEDDNVAIAITGGTLGGSNVGSLNRIAAATSGDITASITASAGDLANISGISDKNLTITVNSAIELSDLDTVHGLSSNNVSVTGSITDSLTALYDENGVGNRKAALNTAISEDTNINIVVNNSSITSGDFAKLNAIAGHASHDSTDGTNGTITANVSGTAALIKAGLGNLSADDQITFTVTGTSNWTDLQQVDLKTELKTIDVEAMEDSYANIYTNMVGDDDFDHADANLTVVNTETINKDKYDNLDEATEGTVDFTLIEDSYLNLKNMGAVLSGKTVTISDAVTIQKLGEIQALVGGSGSITYDISDTASILSGLTANSGSTHTDLTGAGTVTINNAATIQQINTVKTLDNGTTPSYTTINDAADILGANNAATSALMTNKTIQLNTNATATEYRQALTNAGGNTVTGAVVETSSAALASGTDPLTNATSVTLKVQSDDKDFTTSGTNALLANVSEFDLNGVTGVLFNIADIEGKTISDSSSGSSGTYFVSDSYANIVTASTIGGDPLQFTNPDKAKALYGATEIQVTDWATGNDLSGIGNTSVNQTAQGNTAGMASIATTDIKVTLTGSGSTTIDDTIGARLATVTKLDLSGNNTSVVIESDVFDNSANEWGSLTTLTGLGSGNNLTINDVADNSDNFIDLYGISSLTGIANIAINGGTGVDIINLSPALTTHSSIGIDMGDDASADKIYFGIDTSDYSSTDNTTLTYANVSNFNVSHDRVGLYYYGFSGGTISAINETASTGATSGEADLSTDRTFIEEDSRNRFLPLTGFDTVTEVQSVVGAAVQEFTAGANRLMLAHYTFDEAGSETSYAVINAADFSGITSNSTEITGAEDIKVVGIAALAGVSSNSLGSVVDGFNLTGTKNSSLGGA